jgi:hypothetical protein
MPSMPPLARGPTFRGYVSPQKSTEKPPYLHCDSVDHRQLIAILRGILPEEPIGVCETLVQAGISMIEVPLNSPAPMNSIRAAAKTFEGRAVIGAGTVLSQDEVDAVAAAGAASWSHRTATKRS